MDKMRNRAAFQTQLASILEALAKAAETEITKLVEDGSVELRLEVSRSHKEIDWLRKKLQQVESELRTAQGAVTRKSRTVGVQVLDQFDAMGGAVEGDTDAPFIEKLNEKNSGTQTCDKRPDFGSAVKEEPEEESVALILGQSESDDSAGRLNNVGSDHEMFESDHLSWRCFTLGDSDVTDDPDCANATEQFAQSQSILSPKQHSKVTLVESGSTLSSLENDDHVLDGGAVKEEAGGQCSYPEESSIEMSDTRRTEHEQPSLSTSDNPTSQQFCQIKVVSDYSTGPVSSSDQSAGIPWRPGEKEKRHSCPQCQKRFDHSRDLKRHLRRHTGEKPFSCAQCGKRFSLKCSLNRHERIHTGSKPFSCVYCEKRFAQGSHLREHYRVHTGERPYHCALCGKSFTQSSGLKNHQKTHCRN